METLIIILLILFLLFNILFLFTFKGIPESNLITNNHLNFSIIIAAKNEEKNIPSLINSLRGLYYPAANFEVIIIDDNSSDKTYEAAENRINGICNFHLYKVEEKEFPAKKGALDFGIRKAKNPFILITDADCNPGKNWLKIYNQKFQEGFDFIYGTSPFEEEDNLTVKISCFENLRSSILSFTAAKAGLPYTASARNLGFKKSVFEMLEGYSNTTETLGGDDDLLLREAVKNNLKIGTVLNNYSFVYSSAKNNFHEYFYQKARHAKTSFHYLPNRQLILASWHLMNLFFLFSPFLMIFNKLFILLFLIKLTADYSVVKSLQKKFGYSFHISEIIFLQIIYEIFLIVHFINAIFKKDKWK